METNTFPTTGRTARELFPPPALRRSTAPAPALPRLRVVEAHPFRIGRSRYARVVLAWGPLRLAVLAGADPCRKGPAPVVFPVCRGEAGVSFTNPALSAEIERAARAAARRAHR